MAPRSRYDAIENLFAQLVGGQLQDQIGSVRGPDILIRRAGTTPIAIELKVFSPQSFGKTFSNRVADLLAGAVEIRRSFRGDVTLSAVLLTIDAADHPHISVERGQAMAQRLLRADDGIGFDSVLLGSADSELRWRFFGAAAADEGPVAATTGTTTEILELLKKQEALTKATTTRRPANGKQRILMVADEWRSGHGGISTVNRELATSLAAAGVEVAVLLPRASDSDVRTAAEVNVAVVTPARVPGLSDRDSLLLRPVFADHGWMPDVVVGHGRLLGPYAAAQQLQFFPESRRVHFVHTDAEQLEAAKEALGGPSHMLTAEVRRHVERDLARSADLVVGIGPLLTETIRDDLIGPVTPPKAICMIPGLRTTFDIAAVYPPVKNRVLIIGRADDFRSKGIDIAAEAMLKVVDRWPDSRRHPPVLVIRGVPDEASKEVKARLDEILEQRVDYLLRPYSDSEDELIQDLAQARLLLMPSRHEGFGLSAYEAIAGGLPVLISAESGLAEFLRESGLDTSPSSIISTRNSSTQLAIDRWASAIQHVLDNPETARAHANQLRQAVAEKVNWEQSTAQFLAALNSSSYLAE